VTVRSERLAADQCACHRLDISWHDERMSSSRTTALLIAVTAAATIAGCTNDPTHGPKPSASFDNGNRPSQIPSATTTTSSGIPLVRLVPPPASAGELSRRVLTQKDGHHASQTTLRRNARAGQQYWVHAACISATSGKTLSVEVRSGRPGASDDAIADVEIPCDGTVTVNGLGTLPAEQIVVYLRGDQSDVPSGYAIIAPTSSLPKASKRPQGYRMAG
jgi:hypothetical protein